MMAALLAGLAAAADAKELIALPAHVGSVA